MRDYVKHHMRELISLIGEGFHPDDPVVAMDGVINEDQATSANIFLDYAFSELGDEVYDICMEIFNER